MSCRKCKNTTNLEELLVHKAETHGVSLEYWKRKHPEANIEILDALWEKHKNTGKKSIARFGLSKTYE